MPEGINDGTQRICTSKPFCKCVDKENEWDECCCITRLEGDYCPACGAALIVIDFETGEEVAAAAR